MTPKEKAKELVDKFMKVDSDSKTFDGFEMIYFYAQRCALIAVDEILNIYSKFKEHPQYVYWQEVKQEIEKL